MSPRALRALFAVTVVALPVQVAFRNYVGEPYPGLFQPVFAGAPAAGPVITTEEPEITVRYADGGAERLQVEDVLPETRVLHASVFRSAFLKSEERTYDPETARWVARRLQERSGREPAALRVDWYEVDRPVAPGGRPDRRLFTTVELDLLS